MLERRYCLDQINAYVPRVEAQWPYVDVAKLNCPKLF